MKPIRPYAVAVKLHALRDASLDHRLYSSHVEHNLLLHSMQTRTEVLDHLRHTCRQSRTALDRAL